MRWLLIALRNLFFRGRILHWLHVSLNFGIPWIEGYAVQSTHFVSCHPHDSLPSTQSLCLPSVSFQFHGRRRTTLSIWVHCPSFGISCLASDGVPNFTDFFSSSRHSAKGRDDGMHDPSVTHCCGALAAEWNGTWANAVPCPEKNRNSSL